MADEERDLIRLKVPLEANVLTATKRGMRVVTTDTGRLITHDNDSDTILHAVSEDAKQCLLAGAQNLTGAKTCSAGLLVTLGAGGDLQIGTSAALPVDNAIIGEISFKTNAIGYGAGGKYGMLQVKADGNHTVSAHGTKAIFSLYDPEEVTAQEVLAIYGNGNILVQPNKFFGTTPTTGLTFDEDGECDFTMDDPDGALFNLYNINTTEGSITNSVGILAKISTNASYDSGTPILELAGEIIWGKFSEWDDADQEVSFQINVANDGVMAPFITNTPEETNIYGGDACIIHASGSDGAGLHVNMDGDSVPTFFVRTDHIGVEGRSFFKAELNLNGDGVDVLTAEEGAFFYNETTKKLQFVTDVGTETITSA